MNGFKQLVTLASLLILLMALSAGSAQDHPFSEIFPDGPLEFEGEDIEDVGVIQVDGGLIIEENIIEDTSGVYRINLDSDEEVLRLEADDDISLDLDMEGDSIQNIDELEDFFDSACDGEVLADVQNDGSFICVDPTEEVSEDFVDREGDTMTGTLDMRGNDIIDIGNLQGSNIVNTAQIAAEAVGLNELEEDTITINTGNHLVDGGSVTLGDSITLNVDPSGIDWTDTSMDETDVDLSDVGAADTDLNMNNYDIENINELAEFFDSACPAGEAVVDVDDDGSILCTDVSDDVSDDYVSRDGDTMTGTLDMTGEDIIDIGNLEGSSIVNTAQIASSAVESNEISSSAVTSTELDETDSYDLSWTNLAITQSDVDLSDVGSADTDLDMSGNDIENINELADFFDSACSAGEAVVDVDDDGSILCTDVSDDVADDYVSRDGDSMTGTLDMTGNDIIDIGNLEGSSIVNAAQIASSAVRSSEIAEDSVTLDELDQSDVDGHYLTVDGDAMEGTLDMRGNNIIDIGDLSGDDIVDSDQISSGAVGSSEISSSAVTSIELDETDSYDISWTNLAITQSDVDLSDVGAADTDLDMNNQDIQNINELAEFFDSACPTGEALIDVNNDGSFDCMDVSDDVADDYVNRDGDTMTGSLTIDQDMGSTTSGLVLENDEYAALQQGEFEDDQGRVVDENDVAMRTRFRSSSGSRHVNQIWHDAGGATFYEEDDTIFEIDDSGDVAVPSGNLDVSGDITGSDWSDLDIDQSDVEVSDLGTSDDNLDMDGNDITRAGLTHTDELLVSDSPDDGPLPATDNSAYIEGDLSIDGDFIGAGADLAEIMTVSDNQEDELEPGEVVVLDENLTVKRSEEAKDTGAAGVVSTDPAMVMAKDRDGVELALSGTAPVKVTVENGEIQPGDLLTTSDEPGKAMRCEKPVECHGSVIGKAGESISSDGEIEMVITLS